MGEVDHLKKFDVVGESMDVNSKETGDGILSLIEFYTMILSDRKDNRQKNGGNTTATQPNTNWQPSTLNQATSDSSSSDPNNTNVTSPSPTTTPSPSPSINQDLT